MESKITSYRLGDFVEAVDTRSGKPRYFPGTIVETNYKSGSVWENVTPDELWITVLNPMGEFVVLNVLDPRTYLRQAGKPGDN